MELTRKLLDTSSVTLSDQRLVTVVCSTGDPDRMGDVIVQKGIDLTAYRKNPVVLWGHSADVPIARATQIDVKDGKLQATVQFPPEGDDEDSDWVYGKIKAGIVNATSVGFIPKDYEPINLKEPWSGYKFKTSELLEFSFVSIPANSGCLIVGRSMFNGVDMPTLPSLAKASGKLLVGEDDPANEIKIPRNLLEEVFRQAKTPRTVRQKYLAKSETADWKLGAAADLPVVDAETWDAAAAAKRMLDAAGFDGDTPDIVKAAQGFLVHDAANPLLRSSYSLPFADIIDGELKAVKPGIIAAKSRIDQTDATAPVREEATQLADDYEQKEVSPILVTEKSGRRISNANAASLNKALEHHDSAMQCIKDVLASNTPDDDPEDDNEPDDQVQPVTLVTLDARAQRLKEAADFKASLKI